MKPAVIVVDMLEDNYRPDRDGTREEEKIIGPVRDFLAKARKRAMPVVFACDSFFEGDFLFGGRMKVHALRGTEGVQPLRELERQETDVVLEKRRFSAFFKTDLDQTLRTLGCDTVAVCGIQTQFCVLATAFDALCHDFRTVILEDACAAPRLELHEALLSCYRQSALQPLLRVQTLDETLG